MPLCATRARARAVSNDAPRERRRPSRAARLAWAMLLMGRTVCGFVSRPPRTVYSLESKQKYNVSECVHEKNHKGSEAWHAGERTKPGLASQRVGWIECSPGPAKGEIESSSTLLMERSCASQPRQSKTVVEKAMEDKKSTRLCDGTPHGAAVSHFLGCSRHQQRLCRRPRCLAHLRSLEA